MASPTQWTWVWVDSGICWWTGRPGVLRFMGLQRVRRNWVTELNWTEWFNPGSSSLLPGSASTLRLHKSSHSHGPLLNSLVPLIFLCLLCSLSSLIFSWDTVIGKSLFSETSFTTSGWIFTRLAFFFYWCYWTISLAVFPYIFVPAFHPAEPPFLFSCENQDYPITPPLSLLPGLYMTFVQLSIFPKHIETFQLSKNPSCHFVKSTSYPWSHATTALLSVSIDLFHHPENFMYMELCLLFWDSSVSLHVSVVQSFSFFCSTVVSCLNIAWPSIDLLMKILGFLGIRLLWSDVYVFCGLRFLFILGKYVRMDLLSCIVSVFNFLTHWLFKSVLFNFQIFADFPCAL